MDPLPAGAPLLFWSYGVEDALELDSIRDGLSTSLFVVGLSEGGGARFQGPLFEESDAHVTPKFAGPAGEVRILQALGERIPEAIIEFNGCWAQPGHALDRDFNAIARCFVRAMRWLGIRYGCCSAAAYAAQRWEGTGGRVMATPASIPYPSEEYQTTLLWWDERRLAMDADRSQLARTEEEWLKMNQRTTVSPLDEHVASLR